MTHFNKIKKQDGAAALIAVVFLVAITLVITAGFSSVAINESQRSQTNLEGKKSYYLAEASNEDVVYRLATGKTVSLQETLILDGHGASTTRTILGSQEQVDTSADIEEHIRKVRTLLTRTSNVSFNYGVQVGAGGLDMDNSSSVIGNVFSNGSITGANGAKITGDAIVSGAAHRIEDMTIGDSSSGTGRASSFINTKIHGSNCPNSYCIVENPTPQTLPIPQSVIDGWKLDAAAGGQIVGNYNVTSNVSLGPKEITGNLNMTTNNKVLTVTGTIYVRGNIDVSNGAAIRCDTSYGSYSCVVISGGWIHISNNGVFSGSGTSGSYVMLLTTASGGGHHGSVIDLHNSANGAIFYAQNGTAWLHNTVKVQELIGYGVHLDNNAEVTYDSGLANVNFLSGPSGGFTIDSWLEIP